MARLRKLRRDVFLESTLISVLEGRGRRGDRRAMAAGGPARQSRFAVPVVPPHGRHGSTDDHRV
jgi:hypothetical protein